MGKCVLCFILFLAILIVTEVEAVNKLRKLRCPITDHRYKGKCGNNGNSICAREVKEFIAKQRYGVKPVLGEMRCNCTDLPVKANEQIRRTCSCRYDC
ncbi:hypothetical protein Bca4012_102032 [Brassica carinata]